MTYLIKSDSPQGDRLYLVKSGNHYAKDGSTCFLGRTVIWTKDADAATIWEGEQDAGAFLSACGWSLDHPDFELVPQDEGD